LNGLAVNLEVVRSRLAKGARDHADVATFAAQAVSESEQLASITEGIIALLELTVASVDRSGEFRCSISDDGAITLETTRETIERLAPRLESLEHIAGFHVETRQTAVILTFPAKAPED
jgi:hypothetical protein